MSAAADFPDLQKRLREALKAGEREKAGALRLLLAEVRKKEMDGGAALDSAAFAAVVEKMIKQRRESLAHFEGAGREDLAKKERAEIGFLAPFLPEQMSETELRAAVEDALAKSGAQTARDMGKVMAALKPALAGRADMSLASRLVKEKLQP